MKRLSLRIVRTVASALLAASVAACGAGSHTTIPRAADGAQPSSSTGPLANATFTITIPKPTSNTATSGAKRRTPQYVSAATKSVRIDLTKVNGSAPAVSVNSVTAVTNGSGNSPGSPCSGSGPWTCQIAVQVPPGSDQFTITSYDNSTGTGNILSQQVSTEPVVAGKANSFNITLDANANAITVTGSGTCAVGTVASGSTFGSVGTSPVAFTVSYTDPAGKTIAGPGLPSLQIEDNTSIYQTNSGTINGNGGTVSFTINQSAQTFTLTPSNSTVTNVTVNVKGVPPSGSDGLSYSTAMNFKFSTGVAPPSHNFLAVIEEANPGQINLFNVNGSQSSLSAYSPATLAVTNSTNEGNPDINDPLALTWDGDGDLLVGNSNTGGPNAGNMACIPAGAIATGTASSTTVTGDVTVPDGIAYDPTTRAVAVADEAPSGTDALSEFVLNGDYVESSNNLAKVSGAGATGVVDVSSGTSLSAGTFAVAITDGNELDTSHGGTGTTSEIVIFSPNGNKTTITSGSPNYYIDSPQAIAWDPAHQQLLIANSSIWHKQMSIWNIGGSGNSPTFSFAKSVSLPGKQFYIGSWTDGHYAVEYNATVSGAPLVQAYLNNAGNTAPTAIGGPIPFNNADTSADACNGVGYIYGPNANLEAITWLSSTKLLLALSDSGSNASQNGLYIYDTTNLTVPTGYSDVTCAAYAAAPTQTSFTELAEPPAANGVAFLP
ncbi:MAG TPA: hypothetical protein VFB22_00925 [Candidatus Baltobacteraceae bacterium]|nr:hypothetical protein [Candidatus Baltobacteraceae bacterium]